MTYACHSYYDCFVEIHSAARKHGCADSDIQHAVEHQLVVNDLGDDDSPFRLLVLGPDRAGNLLELIVLIFDDERQMAIHAMPIRTKYLSLLPKPGATNA